ncbi:DUF6544 family protein [Shivajiella indica]|uniref:DUF6544 family protein n=1 Tax=Shivajiella indica TaxID=872115 RepID=A0ABW5BEW7_9BACT
MKHLFLIFLIFHFLIHLLGFIKGFQIFEVKEFTIPINKPFGLIWLGTALIFLTSTIFYWYDHPHWWLFALLGVILSQVLIIWFWADAKFGTFPNILIFLVAFISFSQFLFQQKVDAEVEEILKESSDQPSDPITLESIQGLPQPVIKWLKQSGIIGKSPIHSLKITQEYRIKLKPEQTNWYSAKAEQYTTAYPPAFVWTADMKMMPLVFAFGRDKFIDGEGEMLFKLLNLFPVAKDGPNTQINESALQRFLGEIVWNPSSALMDYVTWEEIDENTAKATLKYKNTTGAGFFYFDQNGRLTQFVAERFMGSGTEAKKHLWIVKVLEYKAFDGITLPSKCNATWKLENGDWTWAEFEVTQIEFNPETQ